MHGHEPNDERLAGGCRACQLNLGTLDRFLESAIDREDTIGVTAAPQARLHALALMLSFWLDRTLREFPNDGSGPKAARIAIRNVFREQGLGNTHDVIEKLAGALEASPRQGADVDEPEGSRVVLLSDTVARALVQGMRRELGAA